MCRHGLFGVIALVLIVGCAGRYGDLRTGKLGTQEEGLATYYSPRLAGHPTASGEPYEPGRFTAAHPAIPFGMLVRIVRTDVGNREVYVRINDRCTGKKKIIDVSEAAAKQLDMLQVGIVPVLLTIVAGP